MTLVFHLRERSVVAPEGPLLDLGRVNALLARNPGRGGVDADRITRQVGQRAEAEEVGDRDALWALRLRRPGPRRGAGRRERGSAPPPGT